MNFLKAGKFNYKFWFYFLLIILLILGIYFRFFNLTTKVYWHDEVYTSFYISGYQPSEWESALFSNQIITVEDIQKYQHLDPQKSLKDVLQVLEVYNPHHPPLYYIILHFWAKTFGDSVAVLRSFSGWMSLLALPAIYGLSLELFAVSFVGLWVIVLLTISPFFVLYAQEAREYAFWTVIIILSNWALLRAIRFTDNNSSNLRRYLAWVFYGITLSLGFYTSLFTVLIVFAHSVYMVIYNSFRLSKTIVIYSITVIISLTTFVPWIIVFINNYDQYKASTNWARLIKIPPVDVLKTLALNISRIFVDFGGESVPPLAWVLIIIVLGVVGSSFYLLCRTTPLKIWRFILILVMIPILFLVIPDLVWGGVRSLSPRYLIPSWIGIILGVAYLLANQFHKNQKLITVIAVFILSIGVISDTVNAQSNTSWNKVISYSLPQVATIINQSDSPLLIGNKTSYNPGNIIALSYLLKPSVKLQLLSTETGYIIPKGFPDIFLLSPSDQLREKLEQEQGIKVEFIFGDNHLWLWKIRNNQGLLNKITSFPP
jgi:uncharacterized membrane protein